MEVAYHGLGPNRREASIAKLFRATFFRNFEKQRSRAVIVERVGMRESYSEEGSIERMRVSISSIRRNNQIGIDFLRLSGRGMER